jgi:hypothetical protein
METVANDSKDKNNYLKPPPRLKRRLGVIEFKGSTEKPAAEEKNSIRNSFLERGMKNLYGRHYAIEAKDHFKFQEQWEGRGFYGSEEGIYYEFIHRETPLAYLYTFLLLVAYLGVFWGLTAFRLLQLHTFV